MIPCVCVVWMKERYFDLENFNCVGDKKIQFPSIRFVLSYTKDTSVTKFDHISTFGGF